MEKKTTVRRVTSLTGALLFLAFGANLGPDRFCLGDWILNSLGLPAWSKGTQGLHYPGIVAVIAVPVCFYLFAATTREPKKTMGKLILGTVLGLYFLSQIIGTI